MLEVLATDLDPETTLGEIVDAAAHLGWSDTIGDLCLADLASALRGGAPAPRTAPSKRARTSPRQPPRPRQGLKPARPRPPRPARQPEDQPPRPPAARPLAKSAPLAKPAAPTKPSKAAPPSRRVAVPEDPDGEAMSIEQAAKLLLPMVRRLKQATMQELEESTGMGRRKLRFHIGQLVKNDRLARHGMGRGTYYTIKR